MEYSIFRLGCCTFAASDCLQLLFFYCRFTEDKACGRLFGEYIAQFAIQMRKSNSQGKGPANAPQFCVISLITKMLFVSSVAPDVPVIGEMAEVSLEETGKEVGTTNDI